MLLLRVRRLELRSVTAWFGFAIFVISTTAIVAKDKSGMYQLGTYTTANLAQDGTTTNNIHCGDGSIGGTVCSGGVNVNAVTIYTIKVDDGIWSLETDRQAGDAMTRRVLGEEPLHLKAEKQNLLDLLKNGDKVLFRIEKHKKLLGTEIDIFVPFADRPNKEAKFVATFVPYVKSAQPTIPTDNVRAMCDAHKLSPELEKKFCTTSQP